MASKRTPIKKSVRFEVFKRDKFACQYCGAKAPDVVLHVDHIHPVADGGTSDILNLVTACITCNAGKGARKLSDNTALDKQREQLEELQERREQIEMMMEWRAGLSDLESLQLEAFEQSLSDNLNCTINERGRADAKKWIKKYGLDIMLDSVEAARDQYYDVKGDGTPEQGSLERAWKMIPRIAGVKHSAKEKPYLPDLLYVRGIINNRIRVSDPQYVLSMLEQLYVCGSTIEELKELARDVRNMRDLEQQYMMGLELLEKRSRDGQA